MESTHGKNATLSNEHTCSNLAFAYWAGGVGGDLLPWAALPLPPKKKENDSHLGTRMQHSVAAASSAWHVTNGRSLKAFVGQITAVGSYLTSTDKTLLPSAGDLNDRRVMWETAMGKSYTAGRQSLAHHSANRPKSSAVGPLRGADLGNLEREPGTPFIGWGVHMGLGLDRGTVAATTN